MRRPRNEAGSATVLVLAMAGVLVLIGAALGTVAALVQAHRLAQSGADLAALAGAQGLAAGRDGCLEAVRIAEANHVHLDACRVAGRDVLVTVWAAGPRWLGQQSELSAQARAGPG
jgi:secretion/DNA translocation related TadE-like protein